MGNVSIYQQIYVNDERTVGVGRARAGFASRGRGRDRTEDGESGEEAARSGMRGNIVYEWRPSRSGGTAGLLRT